MKLQREFIRLPLTFDAERMAAEVGALPAAAWQAHPLKYPGNSAVPLVSVDGEANDFFAGPMAETRRLQQTPYLRQVLASFGVVFGRSRLMGLAGGSEVPPHCDINYHWFSRARIHVPIVTWPEVRFSCQDWHALWALHGECEDRWPECERRRDSLLRELLAMRQPLLLASNERVAQKVMLSRVLVACLHRPLPGMNEIQFGT